MSDLTELASADAYCRYLARRHYENFSVASRLLPKEIALDLTRIYAYCRSTDDFGDESGGQALERLNAWRSAVCDLFDGRAPVHPVLVALRETVLRRRLAERPFLDLIQANVQDQSVASYESWSQLRDYCMLSAAPVGIMVLGVYGVHDLRAEQLSDDVCIGLQLANHAQDVRRDEGKGRCYLLQSDVRAGGVVGAVRSLCMRARDLLQSGVELEAMVPKALRAQLALYRLGGTAILAAIERAGYRTDILRPVVSPWTKAALFTRAFFDSLRDNRQARAKLETV